MFEQYAQAVGLDMHPSHWIEKISRVSPGRWVVDIKGNAASRLQIPADDLFKLVNCRAFSASTCDLTGKVRFQSDCASWALHAGALTSGFPAAAVETGHQFFEFESDGTHLIVPAILIVNALFGPIRTTIKYLLEPMGLDYLCVPTLDYEEPGVYFFDWKVKGGRDDSALLSWAHCFPSARCAWDSVLQHASGGCVGINLPNAMLTGTCYGYQVANRVVVTRLLLAKLVATEAPYPFAALHPTAFGCTGHNTRMTVRIPDFMATPTTDLEWLTLSTLFKGAADSYRTTIPKRPIVDALLRKCASGESWRVVGAGCNVFLDQWLVRWRRSGLWDALTEQLTRLRRP